MAAGSARQHSLYVNAADMIYSSISYVLSCIYQIAVEEVLFLGGRGVRGGRLSPPTLALRMGEEYRQPGEDPARNEGRDAARSRGASTSHCREHFV